MFWKKKKNTKKQSEPLVLDASRYSYHVMPEEFLPKVGEKKKKSVVEEKNSVVSGAISPTQKPFNRTKVIGFTIMIVAFFAMIAGAMALFRLSFREQAPTLSLPNIAVNEKKNVSTLTETKEAPLVAPAEEVKPKEIPSESQKEIFSPPVTPKEEEIAFVKGSDLDQDGLTDLEEKFYGSESEKPDSDSDSFLDGEEIRNLYNPLGKDRLPESSLVRRVQVGEILSFLVPSSWQTEENAASSTTFVRIPTGEFFQILVSENSSKLPLSLWYERQNPEPRANEITLEYNDWTGIRSRDSLTVYLQSKARPEMIIVIFYNPLESNILYYEATFEMIIKSLAFEEE